MSLKLKALGLGLLAALSVGAFVVMSASANTGGHFVSEVAHTEIKGSEDTAVGATDRFEFKSHGLEGGIVCDKVSYTGTANATTVTSITVTPKYEACYTTGQPVGSVTVKVTGCVYIFTVGKTPKEEPESSVHLECEANGHIVIEHPNCTITITGSAASKVNQTLTGFSYKTITINNKHAVTVEASGTATNPGIQFATRYEGGICVFTGTNHVGTLVGAATVAGTNTAGETVGVTATGP
jgi:hypothetical protein